LLNACIATSSRSYNREELAEAGDIKNLFDVRLHTSYLDVTLPFSDILKGRPEVPATGAAYVIKLLQTYHE